MFNHHKLAKLPTKKNHMSAIVDDWSAGLSGTILHACLRAVPGKSFPSYPYVSVQLPKETGLFRSASAACSTFQCQKNPHRYLRSKSHNIVSFCSPRRIASVVPSSVWPMEGKWGLESACSCQHPMVTQPWRPVRQGSRNNC